LNSPFVFVHKVRVDEVDAAGIVYFARYFQWCHEAMATMLEPLDGGYASLLNSRGEGLPTVHAEADYTAPLRFGDSVAIAVCVEKIGRSSCSLRFDLFRASDHRPVATVRHVVALTDIGAMQSRPLPADVRSIFERYATA
jgi:4-hydroxybenzoyl-CoA thioesterase